MATAVVSWWPASLIQIGHLTDERTRGRTPYNACLALRASRHRTDDIIEELRRLQASEPILRASFSESEESSAAGLMIFEQAPVLLTELAAGSRSEVDAAIAAHRGTLFDRERAPLWSAMLLTLPGNDDVAVLSLAFDHLIADGRSLSVIARRLDAALAGDPLPVSDTRYREFAEWQRAQFAEPEDGIISFWTDYFRDVPVNRAIPLPFYGDAEPFASLVRRVTVDVEPTLADRLSVGARRHRTTPFVLVLSALGWTLANLAGVNDLSIQVPIPGRPHGHESTLGWFANDVMVRLQRPEGCDAVEFLRGAHRSWFTALPHGYTPLHVVQQRVGPQPPGDTSGIVVLNDLTGLHAELQPNSVLKLWSDTLDDDRTEGLEPGLQVMLTGPAARTGVGARLVAKFDAGRYSVTEVEALLQGVVDTLKIVIATGGVPAERDDYGASPARRRRSDTSDAS
jgi:hypothetical protein